MALLQVSLINNAAGTAKLYTAADTIRFDCLIQQHSWNNCVRVFAVIAELKRRAVNLRQSATVS